MRTSNTFSVLYWADVKKAKSGKALIYALMECLITSWLSINLSFILSF